MLSSSYSRKKNKLDNHDNFNLIWIQLLESQSELRVTLKDLLSGYPWFY